MSALFEFDLPSASKSLKSGLVAIGRFNAEDPQVLSVAYESLIPGRIEIHTPPQLSSQTSNSQQDISVTIPGGGKVTCISCGTFQSGAETADLLVVGTNQSVFVFNVSEQREAFYKPIHDGVNVVEFVSINAAENILMVGGDCSVESYDQNGTEVYWMAVGDIVTSLCSLANSSDVISVAVGTADSSIVTLIGETVSLEYSMPSPCISMVSISEASFVYLLNNGQIGICDNGNIKWSINMPDAVSLALLSPELLVVASKDGQLSQIGPYSQNFAVKTNIDGGIVSISHSRPELVVCCSQNGHISVLSTDTFSAVDEPQDLKQKIMMLQNRKLELLNLRSSEYDSVPSDLKISANFTSATHLSVSVNNGAHIKSVILNGPPMFDNVYIEGSSKNMQLCPGSNMFFPLEFSAYVATKLSVTAIIQIPYTDIFIAVESEISLPKFAGYVLDSGIVRPGSSVTVKTHHRPEVVYKYFQSSFLALELNKDFIKNIKDGLKLSFESTVRSEDSLVIEMVSLSSNSFELLLYSQSMQVCGEVIQDLFNTYLNTKDLDSVASFPKDMQECLNLITQIKALDESRNRTTAEFADYATTIKWMVLKAEDSRVLDNMDEMTSAYASVVQLNRSMETEHVKKVNQQNALVQSLKSLNVIISNAGNLRIGQVKAALVSECRQCVKNSSLNLILEHLRIN